jgi:hypothetical protein
MAGTAVVGAGNYILEIDTGFIQDAFILDDAVQGVLDNTTSTYLTAQQILLTSPQVLTASPLGAVGAT